MSNRIKNTLASLRDRFKGAFLFETYNPVPGAQALVADGVIDGNEIRDPRFQEFFASLDRIVDQGYSGAIEALRVLGDAGSKPAMQFRRTHGAVIMGNQYFQAKAFVPSVIEHTLAYSNGSNDVFRLIAIYTEGLGDNRSDCEGMAEAVRYLTNLPKGDLGVSMLRSRLSMEAIPQDELCRVWAENPELQHLLRGDLGMYRARVLALHEMNRDAYRTYVDAMGNQPSPRINRDEWYSAMFVRRATADNTHS